MTREFYGDGSGTTNESFGADSTTRQLVSTGTGKTAATQTNAKGYLTEITNVDQAGQSLTQRFTITDCN